ncbi:UvrD-helicase domain-containing protein [Methanothermobacter sp.]
MIGIMIYSVLDDMDGDLETEIKRLEYYKKKIIQQLIPSMGEMTDENRKIYGIVRTGIYVDGMKTEDVKEKFEVYDYLSCAGYDCLSEDHLESMIPALSYKRSRYMKPEWASELESWIIPPYHRDKRTELRLTEEQERHANPEPGHRRLRGAAGSGKTLVIAHRAAKLAAKGHRVLIVTFNRTLWHHIREMVDRTPYNFDWSLLTFRHFHGFCSDVIHELRIPCDSRNPAECLLESIQDYDIRLQV